MKLIIIFMYRTPSPALLLAFRAALGVALATLPARALAPFDTDDSSTLELDHAQLEATLGNHTVGDDFALRDPFVLGVHTALADEVQAGVGLELERRAFAAPPSVDVKWRLSDASAPWGEALRFTHTSPAPGAGGELEGLFLLSFPLGPASASWNAGAREHDLGAGAGHAGYTSALVAFPLPGSWLWAAELGLEISPSGDADLSGTAALVGPVYRDTALSLAVSPEWDHAMALGFNAMLSLNVDVDVPTRLAGPNEQR